MTSTFAEFCITPQYSIRAAMHQMNDSAMKIIFVVESGKLLATLTDGDVRRYILCGNSIDDNVMCCAKRDYTAAKTRQQARQILQERNFTGIPVVNDKGEFTEIVFQKTIVSAGKERLALPVVIMAGGKGTRLEPFTKVLPKPLIPVGDLPVMEHIINSFLPYQCDNFHVIVNHKRELIKAYFSGLDCSYEIQYYNETVPLGTGGGLYMLKGKVKSTFFLTNCDILIDEDYADIVHYHKQRGNVVTMVCAKRTLTVPYGVVDIGDDTGVLEMREKPQFDFLTNTGVYIVEPEVLDDIEDEVSIGFPDIIARQKEKGRKVGVYSISDSNWMDMGQFPELEKMREKLYGSK